MLGGKARSVPELYMLGLNRVEAKIHPKESIGASVGLKKGCVCVSFASRFAQCGMGASFTNERIFVANVIEHRVVRLLGLTPTYALLKPIKRSFKLR